MGYTVLYIAFGIVALWLLGEVLLQYKAQLHWRVTAFAGFLVLVAGVATRNVVVIALGTLAFALGQTFVTVAYRRGYSSGWAIGGGPGGSKRRRGPGNGDSRSEPTLRVSEVEPVAARTGGPGYSEAPVPVYHPQAMNDDTGEYAAYGGQQQPQYADAPHPDSYTGQDPLSRGYGDAYDGYGGPGAQDGGGAYAGADRTAAVPGYQDDGYRAGYPGGGYQDDGFGAAGFSDPAYTDPAYRDPARQDGTAAMPLLRDDVPYPDGGCPGPEDYPPGPGGTPGPGACLPPEDGGYPRAQAAYLDPGQYQQGPPGAPGQRDPGPRAQPPYPGQPYPGQPYPDQPYPDQPYPDQEHPGQPYPGPDQW